MDASTHFHQLARHRAALAIQWLARSIAACGGRGSAVYYSRWRRPVMGWYWPYPETTGYIIDTLLRYARWAAPAARSDNASVGSVPRTLDPAADAEAADSEVWNRPMAGYSEPPGSGVGLGGPTLPSSARGTSDFPDRAGKFAERLRTLALDQADWIVSLQYPDGALPGSHVDRHGKKPPSVFNTGQMLIGLCAAADESAASAPDRSAVYLEAARKAADWLARGVDATTGTWTAHAYVRGHSPAYYTHVCWPLLEAWKRTGDDAQRAAAMRVLDTIAAAQLDNGAIRDWGFSPTAKAFTHTIGYTLWGLLESARVIRECCDGPPAEVIGQCSVGPPSPTPEPRGSAKPAVGRFHTSDPAATTSAAGSRVRETLPTARVADSGSSAITDAARRATVADAINRGAATNTTASPANAELRAAADRYIAVATRTAEVMLRKTELRGRLAAAFDLDWNGEYWYACLTGNCQIASVWIRLAELHDDPRFLSVALKALDVVIDAQRIHSLDPNVRGAIGGSKPLYGRYLFMRYPNWAAKFFVDALMDADAALAQLESRGAR